MCVSGITKPQLLYSSSQSGFIHSFILSFRLEQRGREIRVFKAKLDLFLYVFLETLKEIWSHAEEKAPPSD